MKPPSTSDPTTRPESDDDESPSAAVARPSGKGRPRAPTVARMEREALDLYLSDLATSRPLTREGEVEIGQRIERAERARFAAWLASPVALAELLLVADDVRTGLLTVEDLLLEGDAAETSAPRVDALADALDRLIDLAESPDHRDADATRAHVAATLADVGIDTTFAERVERALKAAVEQAEAGPRAEVDATLRAIDRARRDMARARSELVEANLRLSLSIARQFQRIDVPLVDLAQEGNLGLIRAAETFDYRRGHRFGTYAAWWIKQAIRRAILSQGKGLRIPAHLAEARRRIARARRELVEKQGREPTFDEVAEASGVPIEKVRIVAEVSMDPQSLDAPVGEDGDTSFGELVAGDAPMADEILASRRLTEHTRELLASLTPREREVLERRYGIGQNEDETLEEIGRSCSLTRERIRQIEAKALAKLRPRSKKRELGSYLDP